MSEKLSMNIGSMVIQISVLQEQIDALKAELATKSGQLAEFERAQSPLHPASDLDCRPGHV